MHGADSPVNLEEQVCNRFSWKDIPNKELCYNVISRLLPHDSENKVMLNLYCFQLCNSGGDRNIGDSTWLVVA